MGYCEQDLASLLENMPTPFSEAQVCQGGSSMAVWWVAILNVTAGHGWCCLLSFSQHLAP